MQKGEGMFLNPQVGALRDEERGGGVTNSVKGSGDLATKSPATTLLVVVTNCPLIPQFFGPVRDKTRE
jgi:hypothetical protein